MRGTVALFLVAASAAALRYADCAQTTAGAASIPREVVVFGDVISVARMSGASSGSGSPSRA